MFRRMGELLVEYGEITAGELDRILEEQQREYRPFGRIAAEQHGVQEDAIWRAWSAQYARYCPRIDFPGDVPDEYVLNLISSEEAREHGLLPWRDHDGDMIMLTTEDHLAEALEFVDHRLTDLPVVLWLTDDFAALERAIDRCYPAEPESHRADSAA